MQIVTLLLVACLSALVVPWAQSAAAAGDALQKRLSSASDEALVSIDGFALRSPALVRAFYDAGDGSPVWSEGRHLRSSARDLLGLVRSASGHGMSPDAYHADFIGKVTRLPYEQHETARRVDIELVLSDALLSLAEDLLKGRIRHLETKTSSIDASEDIDVIDVVRDALTSGDLQRVVERLAPQPVGYEKVREALSAMRARLSVEQPFDLPDQTLREGDVGGEVAVLQRRLAFLGDLPELESSQSGVFGPPLVVAVKRFQSRHGLEADGVVGRETRAALETPIRKRVEQLELTLERWRWLPREPGDRYVLVNIGGQELTVIENGRSTLQMRVIVGRPFQRTPSFASPIETVVLNPYWEVPHSIAINEILPKLREDALYLSRENMQVLKRGTNQVVNPIPINWNEVSEREFPYRFRQKPGPDNALGRVKFLMPNRYNVYLHDTPAKTLFSRARRCFSHGCVRLENPLELADLLLHDEPGWSAERVRKTLKTEQNYRISLTRHMPVYLVYWTAWVDNAGIVNFRHDVYGRDEQLINALEAL